MDHSTSAAVSSKDEGDPPSTRDHVRQGFEAEDDDDVNEAIPSSKPSPSLSSSSSPRSPSASPQPAMAANGRISVSLPSLMEQKQSSLSPMPVTTQEPAPLQVLALAVPNQNPFPGGPNFSAGGSGGGREDCWTESATEVLIKAWAERYVGLSKGNLKQNNWKEVADIVNGMEDRSKIPRTDIQCKNRIDTVKKKYKTEKARVVAGGGGPSNWKFFEKMDRLLGHIDSNAGALAARTKSGKGSDKAWMAVKGPRSKSKTEKRGWASGWESDGEDSNDDEEEEENAMEGLISPIPRSLHRKILERKGTDGHGHRGMIRGGALLELTKAIESFGEVYEQTERAKLREVVDMEKQRMKFAKEMEVQRMQFFMKTQVGIAKHGSKKARRADVSGNSNPTTEDRRGGGNAD